MPYLRLHCPALPLKEKKLIAKELTNATMRHFRLTKSYANRCTMQFVPFELEDIAIDGKLLSAGGEPDYHLEVSYRNLSEEQKKTYAREVTPLLARLLNVKTRSWLERLLRVTDPPLFRVSIEFHEYADDEYALKKRVFFLFVPDIRVRPVSGDDACTFV